SSIFEAPQIAGFKFKPNRQSKSPVAGNKSSKSVAVPPTCAKSAPPTSQRWIARIVLAVLMPLLFLVIIELGIPIAGFGYNPNVFLRTQISGKDYFVTNEKFGWRFFPRQVARTPLPLRMAAAKSTNEYRIFLFGESAALGDPDPSFGMGRYLEVLLR